jgi:putative endonuclease
MNIYTSTAPNINKLVYYEIFENIQIAIAREKRLKEWPRKWKSDLIEKNNPQWRDLYDKNYC